MSKNYQVLAKKIIDIVGVDNGGVQCLHKEANGNQ